MLEHTNPTETAIMRRGEIVVIANDKGGCGKTTTVLALANCLTELGFKVCCVDLDSSGNLSKIALTETPKFVLYDIFMGHASLQNTILPSRFGDILPTEQELHALKNRNHNFVPFRNPNSKSLSDLAVLLAGQPGAERYIQSLLHNFEGMDMTKEYDFILIDCGHTDQIWITNAIYASNSIIIPCEPEKQSTENGIGNFMDYALRVSDAYNIPINIDGVLLTSASSNSHAKRISSAQLTEICTSLNVYEYRNKLRYSDNYDNAVLYNKPIMDYVANGHAGTDCMNMTLEFLERRGLSPLKDYPGVSRNEDGHLVYSWVKPEKKRRKDYPKVSKNEVGGCVKSTRKRRTE